MLSESDLRRILYLKNLSEVDAQSELGWRAINKTMAPAIRKESDNPSTFFKKWARSLQKRLEDRHRFDLNPHFKKNPLSPLVLASLGLLAFLIGLGSNYFGSGNKVNLWLNPFTGFLFWNLGVFLFLAIKAVLASLQNKHASLGLEPTNKISSLIINKLSRHMPAHIALEKVPPVLVRTQVAFRREWFRLFGKYPMAKLTRLLHILAILFTVGIIAGMYVRGFASNYEFTWDSTFVSPETRSFWVNLVFGPVLWVAKPLFPAGLPAFESNNGSEWIHIFTVAAILYIALPRAILACVVHFRIQKMRQHLSLPFEDQVWQSLYAEADTRDQPLHFVFYSYSLPPKQIDQFANMLKKALPGSYAKGEIYDVSWGDIALEDLGERTSGAWMMVFNGAQTPEEDVHGEFCQNLLQAIPQNGEGALLFLVDSSRVPSERVDQRRENWDRVFSKHGIESWAWLPFGDETYHTVPLSIRDHLIRFAS